MKKIILLLTTTLISLNLLAQSTFQLSISATGSDVGVAVIENNANNFVVLGYNIFNNVNYDFTLAEITNNGALLKHKKIGTSALEVPYSICKTFDGNYIVCGAYAVTTSDFDWFVTKLDTGFNTIWFKHVGATGGNDYANKVIELDPGKYAISGTMGLSGSAKPTIVYFDDNGTILSEVHLNTNQFASPNYKASYLNDGTFGFCNLTNAICIFDSTGSILRNEPSNFGIFTRDILKNSSNGYSVLAASDYGSLQGGTTSLAFYDSVGSNSISIKKYKSIANDLAPGFVIQDDDNNYYITANASSLSTGNPTGIVIKTDSVGNVIWSKKYTPTTSTYSAFNDMQPTSDGGYILTGYTGSGSSQNIFTIKIDSSGNSACNAVNYPLTTLSGSSISATTHSLFSGTTAILSPVSVTFGAYFSNLTTICTSVGLDQIENRFDVIVYPNPASQKLNIESKILDATYATIYSVDGKKILQQTLKNKNAIDISNLVNGIYLLQITNNQQEVLLTKKFAKE